MKLRQIAELPISAASAVVVREPWLYVVADDETHLEVVRIADGVAVQRLPLLDRPLPREPKARKAAKPDFEALTWLPDGALLVLGSGSTEARTTAVVVRSFTGGPHALVDAAPLVASLRAQIGEVNLEGAVVAGGVLRLLSRGDRNRSSFVVDLDLDAALADLARGVLGDALVRAAREVDLGELDGVPLSFTDAASIDPRSRRILISATAEDTGNAYDDGPCRGSVVGVLDADGRVEHLRRVEPPVKIEGVATTGTKLFLVADADDPTRRAPLYEADALA